MKGRKANLVNARLKGVCTARRFTEEGRRDKEAYTQEFKEFVRGKESFRKARKGTDGAAIVRLSDSCAAGYCLHRHSTAVSRPRPKVQHACSHLLGGQKIPQWFLSRYYSDVSVIRDQALYTG